MSFPSSLIASSSHRWVACPGSARAESLRSGRIPSEASEGTAAHELAEVCLSSGARCQAWVGKALPRCGYTVTAEMARLVQSYVTYVTKKGGELWVEVSVDLSPWTHSPERGVADAVMLVGSTLHVADLKFGRVAGMIEARENPQAILYALGTLRWIQSKGLDADHIVISIAQPRLGRVAEWVLSASELEQWGDVISGQASAAMSDRATREPSSACATCTAYATCPEALREVHRGLGGTIGSPTCMEDPETLDDEALAAVLASKKFITSWIEAAEAEAVRRMEAGVDLGPVRLSGGRRVRGWADEARAAKTLEKVFGAKAYERKLLTPAKAEKILGPEGMEGAGLSGLISTTRTRQSVVPKSADWDESDDSVRVVKIK